MELEQLNPSIQRRHCQESGRCYSDQAALCWSEASHKLKIPTLGLMAGHNIHPSDYGIMSHIWMSCRTLHDALDLVIKYKPLMNERFICSCVQSPQGFHYQLDYERENHQHFDPALIQLIELDFASVLHAGSQLINPVHHEKLKLQQVNFQHPPSASIALYEQVFGCPVRFNQAKNEMIISRETMAIPVYSGNVEMLDSLLPTIEGVYSREVKDAGYTQKVYTLLSEHLGHSLPNADEVALSLGLSLSTLKRRLADESTSFQQILDKLRQDVAVNMLKQAQSSITEISFFLGFSTPSAFHRAFKRWTGNTPELYRKHSLQELALPAH